MKKLFGVFLILTLSLSLVACGEDEVKDAGNGKDEETKTEQKEEKNISEEKNMYFKNNEAKLNDLKIKITETKVIPVGQKGNEYGEKPVFAIWYDTTNLSDKEIDPSTAWMVVFEAIQDNNPNAVNKLEVGSLPDEQFLDSQLENIKKDGTVKNAVAYELDDTETPVKLIATQGIAGKKLGEQVFNLK